VFVEVAADIDAPITKQSRTPLTNTAKKIALPTATAAEVNDACTPNEVHARAAVSRNRVVLGRRRYRLRSIRR
jgi:hypothetical protein